MQTPVSSIPRSPQQAINTMSPGDRRVLNENELAQRWGVSPKTLQRWRSEGRGPRYLKLSKRVGYRVTFAVAMPDANYCWTALARSSTNSGTQRIAIVRSSTDQKTAQYVDISCATTSASFDDSSEINLTVYR